jgi:two-component system sensor histidine kinase/response regulator
MTKAFILVVEDDPNLLEGIRAVLEVDGYTVETAENGEQALAVLRRTARSPELVVSDIMMPHMDGIDLLRQMRQVPAWVTIPFIFLTARSEKSDIQRGKQLGVDDYLIKPFDADDLLIAVESRLNRHRTLAAVHQDEMEDLKRRILTILNHEFRTPLTFVVAYADMLSAQPAASFTTDELLTFLKGVNIGAARLRRLIENFIHLVEMETGDALQMYQVRRSPISDVGAIVRSAYNAVFQDSVQHTCTISVADDIPVFVADAEYLRTALIQLLDNAVKFSPPDQEITFGAKAEHGEVHFWVSDSGRGIPPEEQARIWDLFYQVDRAYHEDQGTGSGLAIVRGIAQLHDGRVECHSEPESGSTFTLSLPIITPEYSKLESRNAPAPDCV